MKAPTSPVRGGSDTLYGEAATGINRRLWTKRVWTALAALPLVAAGPAGEQRVAVPGQPPITATTAASGGAIEAERAALRLDHVDLAIEVFPDSKTLSGRATLDLAVTAPVSRLLIDLDRNLPVRAIMLDGRALPPSRWSNPEGRLTVTLPAPLAAGSRARLTIDYGGTPHVALRAPWDDGIVWGTTPGGQPWIATTAQGYGCDLFWPCLDFPAGEPRAIDMHITVPAGLSAPANGALIGVRRHADGRSTWHWRARSTNPYGIALNIGPYEEIAGEHVSRFGNRIPLRFWHLAGRGTQARGLFAEFGPTLDFFETLIGPYPWADEKLGVVETPHLGMEHQTINAYGNDYRKGPEGFDWLFHHELAHEWFGNLMTASDWDDFWLHEGYATYMQPLYGRAREGEPRYAAMMAEHRRLITNRAALISGQPRTANQVYEESEGGPGQDIYYKGAWVLHTLRNLIGDAAFFDATRRLVYGRPDPRPGNFSPRFVTTAEFERLMSMAAGRDLGWFFDVYLRRAALPELIERRRGRTLSLEWRAPGGGAFPLPVEVSVNGRVQRVAMEGGRGELALPRGAVVVIDPAARLLRAMPAQAGAR